MLSIKTNPMQRLPNSYARRNPVDYVESLPISVLREELRRYIELTQSLESENDRLQDDNDTLRSVNAYDPNLRTLFKLTTKQEIIIRALLKRDLATTEALMTLCYERDIQKPDPRVLKVFISQLRIKLKPYGISIQTQWSIGYSISPTSKKIIESMLVDHKKQIMEIQNDPFKD